MQIFNPIIKTYSVELPAKRAVKRTSFLDDDDGSDYEFEKAMMRKKRAKIEKKIDVDDEYHDGDDEESKTK